MPPRPGRESFAVPAADNFRFPTEDLLARVNPRTRFIAVANPNNPTGTLAPAGRLHSDCPNAAPDAALLVDEAYFEFAGETLMPEWRELPNLFVSRTFSKAYGLAGLRIGVLAGNPEQMRMVRRVSSPYNLNSVALACLPDALADQEYIRRLRGRKSCRGRARLENSCGRRGIRYWPSRANFVLMYFGSAAPAFIAAMRERGILVRDRSSDPGCEGCVRITLGSAEHNERLLRALAEVLEQKSLSRLPMNTGAPKGVKRDRCPAAAESVLRTVFGRAEEAREKVEDSTQDKGNRYPAGVKHRWPRALQNLDRHPVFRSHAGTVRPPWRLRS